MKDDIIADFRIVASGELSQLFGKCFVIVDAETGDVLDDVQGYGYKMVQKARGVDVQAPR